MFLKLVKHETHAAARAMVPLLCGLLAMALLARGSVWMVDTVDSPITSVIGVFLIAAFFLGCVAMVVTTMILMMARFAKSIHGDEGYLTNTLPVGINAILLSRLVVCFLTVLVSFAAVYAGIRIAMFGKGDFIISVKRALQESGIETKYMLLKLFCVSALSLLSTILMMYAAISIGHSFATGKVAKSVLFFFLLYIASQIITSVAMVTVLVSKYGTNGLFSMDTNGFPSFMFWFVAAQNICFGSVYYFLTWFTTKKRLNLA